MSADACPDKDTLFGYVTGTIPEAEADAVASHLSSCRSCEQTIEALEGRPNTMIAALRQPPKADAFAEEAECGRVKELLQKGLANATARTDVQVAPPPPKKKPRRVTKLADYELLKKLGQGGMGTVYKARHARLKRVVALKVLPKDRLNNEEAIARFEREIEAVGRLDHPNIVRAMDAREVGGIRFLVMEYVEGLDLAELVERRGPLGIADACETIRQAATGLQCSQENGLVHRDIKPSNLMLTSEGQVKILDLGLAQVQEAESLDGAVTGVGQVMGTPDYIAPEQALESRAVDIRTDIYSLGCSLYFLLSGRPPFSGEGYETPFKKVSGHVHHEVPPIENLRPDIPKPILGLLRKMLAKDPKQRVARPAEVVDALSPFCEGSRLIGALREAQRQPKSADKSQSVIRTGELQASMVETSRDGLGSDPSEGEQPAATGFDPYHRWLGISLEEQPPNHYRLLGLGLFESDPEVIRDAAARQMAHVRTYHLGQHAELSQKILNELGAAKACLLDAEKKAAHDAKLREQQKTRVDGSHDAPEPPPVGEFSVVVRPRSGDCTGTFEGSSSVTSYTRRRRSRLQPQFQKVLAILSQTMAWMKTPVGMTVLAGGLFAAFFCGIILSIQTDFGTVRIEIPDDLANVDVRVDGDKITIDGLEEPLVLEAGEHELRVTSSGYEPHTRQFTLKRGVNPPLEVTLVPRKATALADDSSPTQPVSLSSSSPIVSDFENGPAGWLVHNWTQETPIPNKYSWTPRVSPDGNPGSCLTFEDPQDGKEWGWHASNAHYGNQAHRLGKYIDFEIRATHVDDPNGTYNVGLTGDSNDGRVYIWTKVPRPQRNTWTSYCLKLGPEANWQFSTDDDREPRRATSENIASILTNLIDWRIQGELGYGKDVGFIDNVVFGAAPPRVCVELLEESSEGATNEAKLHLRLQNDRGQNVFTNFPVTLRCRPNEVADEGAERSRQAGDITVTLGVDRPEEVITIDIPSDHARDMRLELSDCENAVLEETVVSIPTTSGVEPRRKNPRWLGYTMHESPEDVAEFADYTNIVFDRSWDRYGDAVIKEARRRGLQVVLEFHSNDRQGIEEKLFPLAEANKDVVTAICWTEPYYANFSPSAIADFGEVLKQRLPGIQFWASFVESPRGKEQKLPVPFEVRTVIVNMYMTKSPADVWKKASGLRNWATKVTGRPVVVRWIATDLKKRTTGIVPETSPTAIRDLADLVKGQDWAGLVMDSYGPRDSRLGLASKPVLVEEVRTIASSWGAARQTDVTRQTVSRDDNSSQPNRLLGYFISQNSRSSVEGVADHTNLVIDRGWKQHGDQLIKAARDAKLPVLLAVDRNDHEGFLQSGITLAQENADVVAGVYWLNPYGAGRTPVEIAEFGQRLKRAHPSLELWALLNPSRLLGQPVPEEVDVLAMDLFGVPTREDVIDKADAQVPDFVKAAEGRPVVLHWSLWDKASPGLIHRCRPGVIEACAEMVEKYGLVGLEINNYGDDSGILGLQTRPEFVEEVRRIAQRWKIERLAHVEQWVKENGLAFVRLDHGIWEETGENGTIYRFGETQRTSEFVGLTGITEPHIAYRLFADRALVSRNGAEYVEKYRGAWKETPPSQDSIDDAGTEPSDPSPEPNTLSETERQEGWKLLFDGKLLGGWRVPSGHYFVDQGCLVSSFGQKPNMKKEFHLFSDRQYSDFHLRLQYRLNERANSGVLLRAADAQHPSEDGLEIQILDNPAHQREPADRRNGSLCRVAPAIYDPCKGAGTWNELDVVCLGSLVKVAINGITVVDVDLSDVSQLSEGAEEHPGRTRTRGYLGFNGFGSQGRVEYRNIRIKELEAPVAQPQASAVEGQAKSNVVPADAKEFAGHYYKAFDSRYMTWHMAEEHCRTVGGHLARVESEEEHAFVTQLVRGTEKMYWLDGNDEVEEGVWRFSDGSKVTFTKWEASQPNQVFDSIPEHSLAFDARKGRNLWMDVSADTRLPFLCEWDDPRKPSQEPRKRRRPLGRPKNAIRFAGHSYMLYRIPATWHVAKSHCETLGGHLVRIESEEEQHLIETMLQAAKSDSCWADGNDAEIEGQWRYSDGTPLSYSNWDKGEPDNINDSQHHLCIFGQVRKWHDDWDSTRRSFICEWEY